MSRETIRDRLDVSFVIEYVAKDLGLVEGVDFVINFRKLKVSRLGDCSWPDAFGLCTIFVNHGKNGWINTLIHELRHCQQMTTGIFRDGKGRGNVFWHDQKMKIYGNTRTQASFNKYSNSPWEIDARAYAEAVENRADFKQLYQAVKTIMKGIK